MEEGGSAYVQRSYPSRKRVSVACQTDNTYTPSGTVPGPVLGSRQRPIVSGILGTSGPIKRPADRDSNPQIKTNVSGTPTSSTAEPTSSRNNASQPATEDGTLRVTIQHFSKMTDTLCSPSKRIKGVPWRIMVMPKQHMVQKKSQKCMGFFLQCCPDTTYSDAWTCQAVAEMRLIAQKPGVQNFVRKTTHVYTAKENDWGYSCFMTWADVLDESQGYIKDDRVTLEITVKSEAPKNMLSREDFRRSIDQWYNLAEMQISRGQVDLSIEANAQALKFCKDKDKLSRDKLEAQRERLVNHKLLESIQRIEKGKETPKSTEALKPTSLRQALTGAQKTLTSTKTGAKGGSKKDRRAATVQQMKKKKAEAKNSDVKRKSTEWEDDRSNSLDSEERKTDSSPATPAEIVHETNFDCKHAADCSLKRSLSESDTARLMEATEELRCKGHELLNNDDNIGLVAGLMARTALGKSCTESDEYGIKLEDCGDLGKLLDDGSSDNSSDYGEDGIRDLCESCASNHHAQHRSSLSSLDDGDERIMVEMCENFCQTEDSGDMVVPMPSALQAVAAAVPRLPQINSGTSRERRNAGSSPNESAFRQNVARMAEATDDVIDKIIRSRDCDLGEKMSEFDHERLIQFCVKHFGIENSEMIPPELAGSDETVRCFTATLNAIMQKRLETISDDHGTCCLASGLCTVHSNRIYKAAENFVKVVEQMFESEILTATFSKMALLPSDETPKKIAKTSNGIKGRKIATAVRRHTSPPARPPPADYAVTLAETDGGDNSDLDVEDIRGGSVTGEDMEQQMRELLSEINHCRVHDLILDKIESMEREPNTSSIGLRALLVQLFNYSQTLSVTGDRMETMVAQAREVQQIIQGPEAMRAAELMKRSEQKLAEAEQMLKQMKSDMIKEGEGRKKAEVQRAAEIAKTKEEHDRAEQLHLQLREARNQLKKAEKKTKQEENRVATLQSENLELEDRVKSIKKELEQIKKKSAEERAKMKKDKEKDAEQLRRHESEALEREAERDRERQLHEDKLREWKSKEQKWDKEKKQLSVQLITLAERARTAEAAQLEVTLASGIAMLERAREEAAVNHMEAEDNFKRARTHSDMETMRRSVSEWKAVQDECLNSIRMVKCDFESAVDSIRKGQRTLAQYADLKMPMPPAFPRVVRLPPVQVVQPSTPLNSTTIQPPPAGVIGQPRTPQSNRYQQISPRDVQSPSASNSQLQSPSVTSFSSRAPSPPLSQFDRSPINQHSMGLPSGPATTGSQSLLIDDTPPTASPWSWSTPLGNLSDLRPLRPASEQAQQHSQQDLWNGAGDAQVRAPPGYGPMGWSSLGGIGGPTGSAQSLSNWRGPPPPPGHPYKYGEKYPGHYYDN